MPLSRLDSIAPRIDWPNISRSPLKGASYSYPGLDLQIPGLLPTLNLPYANPTGTPRPL